MHGTLDNGCKTARFSQSLSIPMSGSEAIIEASGFQASFHRFLAVCRFHSFRTFHTLYCDVDVRGGLSARGPFMSIDAILLTHLAVNHTSSDEAQWETVIVMSVTDLGCHRGLSLVHLVLLVRLVVLLVALRSSVRMGLTQCAVYIQTLGVLVGEVFSMPH